LIKQGHKVYPLSATDIIVLSDEIFPEADVIKFNCLVTVDILFEEDHIGSDRHRHHYFSFMMYDWIIREGWFTFAAGAFAKYDSDFRTSQLSEISYLNSFSVESLVLKGKT